MTRATTQNRFRGRSPHAAERTKPSHTQPSHTQPSGTQSSRYAAGSRHRRDARRDSAAGEAFGQIGLDGGDADPVLPHRVALPYRHRLVVQGVEVDRDTERGADLVLTPVAAADRAGVVEVGG